MSKEAFRPITTSTRLEIPRGHRIWTTGREVPAEYPLPSIGDAMTNILGTSWSSSIIFSINERPVDGKLQVTYGHTTLPSSPWTKFQYLKIPKNHKLYTTVILIPYSYTIPEAGQQISAISYLSGVAAGRQSDYIVDVRYPEAYGGYRLEIDHMTVPSGSFTEYESVAYTFPPIYPNATAFFPGGSKPRSRVVPARVVYEYQLTPTSPTNWLTAATIWDYTTPSTGPFEVKSYLAEAAGTNFIDDDGTSGSVGEFLNPSFIGQDSINDAFNVYSPADLAYAVGASSPSAATYADWVANNTEIMVSRTIHSWYEFTMRRSVFVRAQ